MRTDLCDAPELKYLVVLPGRTRCMELWSWMVTSSVKLNHVHGARSRLRFSADNKLIRMVCPGEFLGGERFDRAFVHAELLAARNEDERLHEWLQIVEMKLPRECSLEQLDNFFHDFRVPVNQSQDHAELAAAIKGGA